MRVALAKHFSGLNSRPLVSASRALVATGKTIYEEGDPNSNVPACMACHGGDAKGHEEIPRLAGQLPDYIFNKLVNWNKERGQDPKRPDISAIMLPTSHNLTKSQIASCRGLCQSSCSVASCGYTVSFGPRMKCEAPMIILVRSKIAVLALVASTIPSWAAGWKPAKSKIAHGVTECSAQGYEPAPRLAGQRLRTL